MKHKIIEGERETNFYDSFNELLNDFGKWVVKKGFRRTICNFIEKHLHFLNLFYCVLYSVITNDIIVKYTKNEFNLKEIRNV